MEYNAPPKSSDRRRKYRILFANITNRTTLHPKFNLIGPGPLNYRTHQSDTERII